MNSFRTAAAYLTHRMHCANSQGHGVHSPFLFEFITQVLPDAALSVDFEKPEQYRKDLLSDETVFSRTDFGSGREKPQQQTSVRSLARRALQSPRGARLLYRMIKHYRPGPMLELGTCFGVTTEYLAVADPHQPVYTLEGDPLLVHKASERFRDDGFTNIQSIVGDFEETLPDLLQKINSIGFAWVDGNHRQAPTLRYFEQLLAHATAETILVFDDIYWSKEMEAAWQLIRCHPRVGATIDLFRFGIVFLRTEFREPVHLRLHY